MVNKVGDYSRGWPEGSLFNSYYTEVKSATPFPRLFHFILDPYLIVLSAKQGSIKYHSLSLWYDLTWDWTQSLGPLENTLLIRLMAQYSTQNIAFLNWKYMQIISIQYEYLKLYNCEQKIIIIIHKDRCLKRYNCWKEMTDFGIK